MSASTNSFDGHIIYPAYVTEYDIQTADDQFFYHHLKYLCDGPDLSKWPLVKNLVGLGQDLVDAPLWANLATSSIYATDQPRAKPIVDVVNECAKILGITPPPVHIKGDSRPNAYVSGLKEPHVLVLTSSLLDLYQESPNELRFIIGHELGHIKAGHIRAHFVGRMLVDAIVGERGERAHFASDFVAALPIHTLLYWYRESEYSADRAGLLCIGGDVNTAKQALLRLMHWTRPSNKLFDPLHPDFDPQLVLARQMHIREKPFVEVFLYIRGFEDSHPFIPERCAALQTWTLSSEFASIMERKLTSPSNLMLQITEVQVNNIPRVDRYIPYIDSGAADPFGRFTYAGASTSTTHLVDATSATWTPEGFVKSYQDGASVIIELFDYNSALPNKLIGSCLVPIKDTSLGQHEAVSELRLDMLDRSTVIDLPSVSVKYAISKK